MKIDTTKLAQCIELREVIERLRSDNSIPEEIKNKCLEPFIAMNFQYETHGDKPNIIMSGMINAFYNGVALALGISDETMLETKNIHEDIF